MKLAKRPRYFVFASWRDLALVIVGALLFFCFVFIPLDRAVEVAFPKPARSK